MSRFKLVTEDPWEHGKIPPATQKQIDFIDSLCGKLGYEYGDYEPRSVRDASEIIDELKGDLGWDD